MSDHSPLLCLCSQQTEQQYNLALLICTWGVYRPIYHGMDGFGLSYEWMWKELLCLMRRCLCNSLKSGEAALVRYHDKLTVGAYKEIVWWSPRHPMEERKEWQWSGILPWVRKKWSKTMKIVLNIAMKTVTFRNVIKMHVNITMYNKMNVYDNNTDKGCNENLSQKVD